MNLKICRKAILSWISILIILPFLSCRKAVPGGTIISTNGTVYDQNRQINLANAPVYLVGGHNQTGAGGLEIFFDTIALTSVSTDSSGNFKLQYKAQGNYDDYALTVLLDYTNVENNENYIPIGSQLLLPFHFETTLKNVILNAHKHSVLKLQLKVLSNPYDTFRLQVFDYPNFQPLANYQFVGQQIDTVLYTLYQPKLQYHPVRDPDHPSFGLFRLRS